MDVERNDKCNESEKEVERLKWLIERISTICSDNETSMELIKQIEQQIKVYMKAIVKEEKEVNVKTIRVEAGVRYWEDAIVNGVEDESGELIPCREGGLWKPIIDIDKGVIKNWKKGTIADIHYKVCDAGSYFLEDEKGNVVLSIEDDYVPKIMCPEDEGWGDYIIMKVDGDGKIANWNPDLDDFQNDDE